MYDAYEAIQGTAGMDIGKLKERVGERICLWGGIWHEHIISGSVEDIRNDARYAFGHAAPGGGFILGTSDSMQKVAPLGNVVAFSDAARLFGRYPISA